MAIHPHTVDIVVKDMAASLAFYRLLGLSIPAGEEAAPQVEASGGPGYSIGFVLEEMVRQSPLGWVEPVGQRVTLAFKCDGVDEVDATYAAIEAAGYPGLHAPWDAFWGQRYASLRDPDGNRVDVFAPLS